MIAKLDQLTRNVRFISSLMESGVQFQAVDMPEANRLTVHMLAAVAEHEREAIHTLLSRFKVTPRVVDGLWPIRLGQQPLRYI